MTPLARVKEGLDDEVDLSDEDRAAVEDLIDDVAEETGEPADPHDPLTAYTFEARTELRQKLEGTDEESVDLPLGRSVPTATIEEDSAEELQLKLVGDSVADNAIVDTIADPGKYALVGIDPSRSSPLRAAVTITGEGIGANLYGPDTVRDSMWLTWAEVFEQADSIVVEECLDSLTSSLEERTWTLED